MVSVNPFKECQELNLLPWECPPLLFIIMGIINIAATIGVYLIAIKYQDLRIGALIASFVTLLILVVGYFVVQGVSRVAEAGKMKTEFVSIASHQLRTPLTSLNWSIEELGETNLNEKQSSLLETMGEAGQGMLKIVNSLLDVSRIEDKKIQLDRKEVFLEEIVTSVIKELSPVAHASNVELKFTPPKEKNNRILVDAYKIKMVVSNLVDNAINYSQPPGKVKIAINTDHKRVILSVKDNGVGIPKSQQALIFEKFFRSDNVLRRRTKGSGLGLFIAKAFIEAHQGKIWFTSEESRGTTFFAAIPKTSIKNN